MKQKIRVIDNINGKIIQGEKEIRAKDHFEAQLKYKHLVYKNKKLYTRKEKYKGRNYL